MLVELSLVGILDTYYIFPPQFEPFQAYLSGPYLQSLLQNNGIRSNIFDANIDFYNWLVGLADDGVPWPVMEGNDSEYLATHVSHAVEILKREPESLDNYRWAINVIDEYLASISPEGVEISLTSLKVGNRYSSSSLKSYIDQPDNLFQHYFKFAADKILGPPSVGTYLLSLAVIDQLPAALVFAQEIKLHRPQARVLVGGTLVSRLHDQLESIDWIKSAFDAIVPGEGRRVLPKLFGIDVDADCHVAPDFSDLDLDQYWSCGRVLPYLVAHGCAWGKCQFCSHHLSYEKYHASSMDSVLDDLQHFADTLNIEYISFSDEYLTPFQMEQLADGLLDRDIDLKWSTFARPEAKLCDVDYLTKLYRAGCRLLMFGLESCSQSVLDRIEKGTIATNYKPILESCKAANIAVRSDFMIGLPGETIEDSNKTIVFVSDNRDVIDTPFSSFAVAVFEMRKGIPLMDQLEEYGITVKQPLRGDLDDQFEYEYKGGLSKQERGDRRAKLIKIAKEEMNIELIAPQNKTHQLILKALFDKGHFELPIFLLEEKQFANIYASFADGAQLVQENGGCLIVNYATGGELDVSSDLHNCIAMLAEGTSLDSMFLSQSVMDSTLFSRFVDFLHRNDYVVLSTSKGGNTNCKHMTNEPEIETRIQPSPEERLH